MFLGIYEIKYTYPQWFQGLLFWSVLSMRPTRYRYVCVQSVGMWRQVFGEFPPSTRTLQDVGNLTIVDVSLQDDGTYECVASNLAASIVTVTVLIVHCQYSTYTHRTLHTGFCVIHYRSLSAIARAVFPIGLSGRGEGFNPNTLYNPQSYLAKFAGSIEHSPLTP